MPAKFHWIASIVAVILHMFNNAVLVFWIPTGVSIALFFTFKNLEQTKKITDLVKQNKEQDYYIVEFIKLIFFLYCPLFILQETL